MRHSLARLAHARLALAAGVMGLFVIAGPATARAGIAQEEFSQTWSSRYIPSNGRASGWAYGCYTDNGYGRRSCGNGASRIGEGDNRLPPPGETPSRVVVRPG